MLELKPGDIFCSRNPMWLGRAICAVEKWKSKDNHAEYSHAGVILDEQGTTFEAVWTNRRGNLFRDYAGQKILIGRHERMDQKAFQMGWNGVKKYEGQWYAGWRLLLHALPFGKLGSGDFAVCSELAMKFLSKSGVMVDLSNKEEVARFIRTGESIYWKGWNPDDVADMIKNFRLWTPISEGDLPA